MKAAVTQAAGGTISVEDVDEPEKRSGSVLVDLGLALLTASDGATYATGSNDLFPLIQGSGGVGTLASGGGSLMVGSRVAIWPRLACGRCRFCATGRRDGCIDGTTLGIDTDGTLAQRVLVPRDNAVNVPSTLAAEVAAAGIDYADAWHLLKTAAVADDGRKVAIVGSAPTARAAGLIAEWMTDDVVVFASSEALPGDGSYDAIIAIGSAVGPLIDKLAIEGMVVVRSPVPGEQPIDAAILAERRLGVVGAGPGGRQDFVEVLRWIAHEQFAPPVQDTVTLDGVGRALGGAVGITDPVPVVLV